jgi:hypothetical protein
LGYLLPVVDAEETSGVKVVGCGVEQSLALKAEYIFGQVVNKVAGAKNRLVAAKDIIRGRNKRKVAL